MEPGGHRLASTYLGRYLAFNQPTDHDQTRMPQRQLSASPHATPLPGAAGKRDLSELPIPARAGAPVQPLARLLAESGTTAMLVVNGGRLVWEHYAKAGIREQPNAASR